MAVVAGLAADWAAVISVAGVVADEALAVVADSVTEVEAWADLGVALDWET